MKLITAIFLLAAALFSVANADSSFIKGKYPDFDKLVNGYVDRDLEIDADIAPTLTSARDAYSAELDKIIDGYNDKQRPDEAEKIQKEVERFHRNGLKGYPSDEQPTAVKIAWSDMLRTVEQAEKEVRPRRQKIRNLFLRALGGIESSFREAKDGEGLALAGKARACVSIRDLIEDDRLAETKIYGESKNPWRDVANQGGYIVGFETSTGQWWQHQVLGEMKPIFETLDGPTEGARRGGGSGEVTLAKEGYAVGGLSIRSGDVVNAVQIIFMRINPDGMSLDTKDSYRSEWLGGKGGGKPNDIDSRGHLIVGVTGKTGDIIDGLGLVYLR